MAILSKPAIQQELAESRTDKTWRDEGRNARALAWYQVLRSVLILLKSGSRVDS